MTRYRLYRIEPCANETYSTAERCQLFKGNPSWIIDKWARCVGCQFDGTTEVRTEVVVEAEAEADRVARLLGMGSRNEPGYYPVEVRGE